MLENWSEAVRTIFFVLMAVVGAVCIIHLTWYWGIRIRYDDAIWDLFADAATEKYQLEGDRTYEVVEDGYRYRVYDTKYLESSGFACVGAETGWLDESERADHMLEKDGVNVILNIGFKVFCHYSFQVDIESIDGSYQIEVDRHGNLIIDEYADPKYKKKLKEILDENRAEIERLFYYANEKWNVR
ncbi:MAG: hypothetical protein K2K70_14040 [Lachnospiraceae bacterium]|nr:hypothetical protein [Lachnospiraceae bacterium]